MPKQKQYTVEQIKKDFVGSNISKRTAKVRLAMVHPGDTEKVKEQRASIMSGIIRDKAAVNSKPKRRAA